MEFFKKEKFGPCNSRLFVSNDFSLKEQKLRKEKLAREMIDDKVSQGILLRYGQQSVSLSAGLFLLTLLPCQISCFWY